MASSRVRRCTIRRRALDFTKRDPDAVGAIFCALGEDADPRPVREFSWMSGTGLYGFPSHTVEQEYDLDVRELIQSSRAFGS
jgi:hypothetical protein